MKGFSKRRMGVHNGDGIGRCQEGDRQECMLIVGTKPSIWERKGHDEGAAIVHIWWCQWDLALVVQPCGGDSEPTSHERWKDTSILLGHYICPGNCVWGPLVRAVRLAVGARSKVLALKGYITMLCPI